MTPADSNVQALRSVDDFHKNAALMFEDIHASIQQRGLAANLTSRQGPEGQYGLWNSKDSEHKRLFVFEYAQKYRFVQMLVKIHDGKLRGGGTKYKAVCARLEVDPVFPLLIVWGVFHPRDIGRFNGDGNVRRNWADNTVLLGVPDDITLADPSSYTWDGTVSVESPPGTDSWHCESAAVRLRRLTDIHDTRDVGNLVTDLMDS